MLIYQTQVLWHWDIPKVITRSASPAFGKSISSKPWMTGTDKDAKQGAWTCPQFYPHYRQKFKLKACFTVTKVPGLHTVWNILKHTKRTFLFFFFWLKSCTFMKSIKCPCNKNLLRLIMNKKVKFNFIFAFILAYINKKQTNNRFFLYNEFSQNQCKTMNTCAFI